MVRRYVREKMKRERSNSLANKDYRFSKKGQLKIQVLKNLKRFLGPESKLAQLKIQEMAFMLLAVFLFFAMVGLFALAIVYTNIGDSATQIAEDRTLSSLVSLADSPELSCVAARSNCIDGDKLVSLVGTTSYQNFWPYSSLKVIRFTGFGKAEDDLVECNFASYPNCDVFVVYDKNVDNERAISTFVALCRKELENSYTYDKCEIAKIVAGTQLKNFDEEKQSV